MTIADPACRRPAGDRVPQRRVGGHAAAHHDAPGADLLGRPDRLGRQHVHHRVLEAPGQLGDDGVGQRAALALVGREAGLGAGLRDDPPRRRLEPREADRSYESPIQARGKTRSRATARVGGQADGRAARVAETQQAPDLVERLARGVVHRACRESRYSRWSRISTRNVCPPDTTSATSGNGGTSRSASPGSVSQPAYTWPSRWFTGTSGLPCAQASVLAKLMPTSSDPASPGPYVTATPSTSAMVTPAVARASSSTGTIQRRWARAATSGTMPPVGRVERDLAGDDVGVDPAAVLDERDPGLVAGRLDGQQQRAAHAPAPGAFCAPDAPAVSPGASRSSGSASGAGAASSSARRRAIRSRHRRLGQRLRGHDQRVFLVVAVVARAGCRRAGTRTSRTAGGRRGWTGGPRASPRARGGPRARSRRRQQQPLPDPATPIPRVHGEGGHVGLVHHQPDAAVGHDLATDGADQVLGEAVRLELLAVRVGRPRGRERGTLDELDRRQVGDGHGPDPEDGRRTLMARPPLSSTPSSAGSAAHPARQRDVLGHERREVVRIAGREARGAGRQQGRRQPIEGGVAEVDGRRRVRAREVHGDEPLARDAAPGPCRRAGSRAARRPATRRGRRSPRAGAASDRAGRSRRPRPPRGARCPVATPTIGSRSAWARPFAVAIPTRRPVKAPGPVPTTRPPSAAGAIARSAQQRLDPRQQLLAVTVAGHPRRAPRSAVPSVEPSAMTARVVAVSISEERTAGGHAAASRYRA